MTSLPVKFVEYVAAFGAVCATAYYFIGIWSARAFLSDADRESRDNAFSPPISILKPLKGMDPQLYESLRSHCRQDYPDYELIFGVRDLEDPAVPVVRQLQAEFPHLPIQLIICNRNLGQNTKVSNLAQMVLSARHDHLIVNDGDIRVPVDQQRRAHERGRHLLHRPFHQFRDRVIPGLGPFLAGIGQQRAHKLAAERYGPVIEFVIGHAGAYG